MGFWWFSSGFPSVWCVFRCFFSFAAGVFYLFFPWVSRAFEWLFVGFSQGAQVPFRIYTWICGVYNTKHHQINQYFQPFRNISTYYPLERVTERFFEAWSNEGPHCGS